MIQILVTLFAGFALILAAVGVYGVVSFTTSQRLPEIGVRVLDSLLYGVSPMEPVVIGGVVSLLAVVTVLAALSPALRAMRTDPAAVLRSE